MPDAPILGSFGLAPFFTDQAARITITDDDQVPFLGKGVIGVEGNGFVNT